jgi:hypothetical protein
LGAENLILAHGLAQRKASGHSSFGIVSASVRQAKNGHDRVSNELLQGSTVT